MRPWPRCGLPLAPAAKPVIFQREGRPHGHGARHQEQHRTSRVGWLRAAVLGANDGIVSTASLLVGVAAAEADHGAIMLSGAAGLVAGAMSMAAGEYVSVSSQADTEQADLARERQELADDAAAELAELTGIYVHRGLDPKLAHEVALQLTSHDALGAHARDELGITEALAARPVQAALASAAMFSIGAGLPLVTASVLPANRIVVGVSLTSLLFLGALGGVSAQAGGAKLRTAILRVTVWGALAMAATALIGTLLGVSP